MKIVLVNGPPRSGKDTLGSLFALHRHAHVEKFARRLKEAAHALYGMLYVKHDAFESLKDEPCPKFRGKTPREVYIALSETYFKPLYGERIFGELLLEELKTRHDRLVVVTDSGFVPEAMVLIEHFGPEACTLLRVHRPGCDFSGDSRGYVELPIRTIDVENGETLKELTQTFHLLP